MTVPTQTTFDQIPVAGVFTDGQGTFMEKIDSATLIDLATAQVKQPPTPTSPYWYLPGAYLVTG